MDDTVLVFLELPTLESTDLCKRLAGFRFFGQIKC
jgi:hypothetical protein